LLLNASTAPAVNCPRTPARRFLASVRPALHELSGLVTRPARTSRRDRRRATPPAPAHARGRPQKASAARSERKPACAVSRPCTFERRHPIKRACGPGLFQGEPHRPSNRAISVPHSLDKRRSVLPPPAGTGEPSASRRRRSTCPSVRNQGPGIDPARPCRNVFSSASWRLRQRPARLPGLRLGSAKIGSPSRPPRKSGGKVTLQPAPPAAGTVSRPPSGCPAIPATSAVPTIGNPPVQRQLSRHPPCVPSP